MRYMPSHFRSRLATNHSEQLPAMKRASKYIQDKFPRLRFSKYCQYRFMSKPHFARIFQNGSSQAVRLPKEFRFEGDRVRVRRLGTGVLLEPITLDVDAFFKAIDGCDASDFMANGREQPGMPDDAEIRFD